MARTPHANEAYQQALGSARRVIRRSTVEHAFLQATPLGGIASVLHAA